MKEFFATTGKKQVLERNQFLAMPGETDTHVYFVESGSLRVFVSDGEVEQNIRFGYQGNIIVLLDSYLTGKPTEYHVQAIKKTVLRTVTRDVFEQFINGGERLQQWVKILENLVLQQLEREVDILISTPAERYRRVLKRSPQLFQEIPERHIANYLRMSPETLSRLKKP